PPRPLSRGPRRAAHSARKEKVMSSNVRRRAFLKTSTLALLGAVGAACARRDLSATPAAAPATPAASNPAPTAAPTTAAPAAGPPAAPAAASTAGPSAAPTAAAPAAAAKPVGTPKRGGTLTALVQNDWVRLDPLFDTGSGNGFDQIFDTYVRWV